MRRGIKFKVGRTRPRHIAGEMNRLEAEYSGYLNLRQRNSEILGFEFEKIKFKLADKTYYTPDFMVYLSDGTIEFHETKGFLEEDANVKLKVVAALFPFTFVLVRKTKNGWEFKEYGK